MAAYWRAKRAVRLAGAAQAAVVNIDDQAPPLPAELQGRALDLWCHRVRRRLAPDGHRDIALGAGLRFTVVEGGRCLLQTRVIGLYNVSTCWA